MNEEAATSDSGAGAGEQGPAPADWPVRPWLLAGLLGLAGLLIHLVSQGGDHAPWQMAAAAFLFFGSIGAAFTLERDRWQEPALFALAAGVVMAGLAWRATAAGDRYADEEYGFAAGVLATALALPLFQAGFHRRRFRTAYADFHDHVWTDAISAGGALAFTGLSWLVLLILSELFHLLQIDLLRDLMNDEWFAWTFSGLAAGAALGTIRNELRLLGTLRTIVVLVLSLLAVPVAAALVLFLLSMVVSGPEVLWEATRSATPVLLTCAAGAFALANTILRQDDVEMPRSRVMRTAALMLALTILPLTVFAAVSMGTRIDQHGLSPERLWGLIAIAVATAFGLAYFVAVVRGRRLAWRERLREANLNLAAGISALALLLALPILDFGALSARDQVGRLQSGEVLVDEFDFSALRWDFGVPGRRALARLGESGNAKVAELAKAALAQTERVYPSYDRAVADETREERIANLRFQTSDPETREAVTKLVQSQSFLCQNACVVLDLDRETADGSLLAIVEEARVRFITVEHPAAREGTGRSIAVASFWQTSPVSMGRSQIVPRSRVEIRSWTGRRVYVDGEAIGEPFE